MKLNKKVLLIVLIVMGFLIGMSAKVYASSISISSSKSTVSAGESFSVTITASDATGRINISVENGTASNGSVWLENNSQTVNVTAGSSGTVKISASGEVSDNNGTDQNVSKSTSVTIKSETPAEKPVENEKPTNNSGNSHNSGTNNNSSSNSSTTNKKSSNANLSNLVVSPVDFKGFKASKTSGYSVTVNNDVTEVGIKATTQDSKASVKVSGNKSLTVGENIVNIEVTAEDGTKKTYKVTVNRKEAKEETPQENTNKPDETVAEPIQEEPKEEQPQEKKEEEKQLGIVSIKIEAIAKDGLSIEPNLTPKFDINNYEYKTTVPIDIEDINIEAMANVEGAKVEIMGNKNLVVGENVITILLKSPDNSKQQIYQIIVTKTEESLDLGNNNTQLVKDIIIYVIIGIIVLAVIAAIIIVWKKKNNQKKQKEDEDMNMISSIYNSNTEKVEEQDGKKEIDEIIEQEKTNNEEKSNYIDGRKNGKRFK